MSKWAFLRALEGFNTQANTLDRVFMSKKRASTAGSGSQASYDGGGTLLVVGDGAGLPYTGSWCVC